MENDPNAEFKKAVNEEAAKITKELNLATLKSALCNDLTAIFNTDSDLDTKRKNIEKKVEEFNIKVFVNLKLEGLVGLVPPIITCDSGAFYDPIANKYLDDLTNGPILLTHINTWLNKYVSEKIVEFTNKIPEAAENAVTNGLISHFTKNLKKDNDTREDKDNIIKTLTELTINAQRIKSPDTEPNNFDPTKWEDPLSQITTFFFPNNNYAIANSTYKDAREEFFKINPQDFYKAFRDYHYLKPMVAKFKKDIDNAKFKWTVEDHKKWAPQITQILDKNIDTPDKLEYFLALNTKLDSTMANIDSYLQTLGKLPIYITGKKGSASHKTQYNSLKNDDDKIKFIIENLIVPESHLFKDAIDQPFYRYGSCPMSAIETSDERLKYPTVRSSTIHYLPIGSTKTKNILMQGEDNTRYYDPDTFNTIDPDTFNTINTQPLPRKTRVITDLDSIKDIIVKEFPNNLTVTSRTGEFNGLLSKEYFEQIRAISNLDDQKEAYEITNFVALVGGHYVSFIKDAHNTWWECNDSDTNGKPKKIDGDLFTYLKNQWANFKIYNAKHTQKIENIIPLGGTITIETIGYSKKGLNQFKNVGKWVIGTNRSDVHKNQCAANAPFIIAEHMEPEPNEYKPSPELIAETIAENKNNPIVTRLSEGNIYDNPPFNNLQSEENKNPKDLLIEQIQDVKGNVNKITIDNTEYNIDDLNNVSASELLSIFRKLDAIKGIKELIEELITHNKKNLGKKIENIKITDDDKEEILYINDLEKLANHEEMRKRSSSELIKIRRELTTALEDNRLVEGQEKEDHLDNMKTLATNLKNTLKDTLLINEDAEFLNKLKSSNNTKLNSNLLLCYNKNTNIVEFKRYGDTDLEKNCNKIISRAEAPDAHKWKKDYKETEDSLHYHISIFKDFVLECKKEFFKDKLQETTETYKQLPVDTTSNKVKLIDIANVGTFYINKDNKKDAAGSICFKATGGDDVKYLNDITVAQLQALGQNINSDAFKDKLDKKKKILKNNKQTPPPQQKKTQIDDSEEENSDIDDDTYSIQPHDDNYSFNQEEDGGYTKLPLGTDPAKYQLIATHTDGDSCIYQAGEESATALRTTEKYENPDQTIKEKIATNIAKAAKESIKKMQDIHKDTKKAENNTKLDKLFKDNCETYLKLVMDFARTNDGFTSKTNNPEGKNDIKTAWKNFIQNNTKLNDETKNLLQSDVAYYAGKYLSYEYQQISKDAKLYTGNISKNLKSEIGLRLKRTSKEMMEEIATTASEKINIPEKQITSSQAEVFQKNRGLSGTV